MITAWHKRACAVALIFFARGAAAEIRYKEGVFSKEGIPQAIRHACETADPARPTQPKNPGDMAMLAIFSDQSGARGAYGFSVLLGKAEWPHIYYDAKGKVLARIKNEDQAKKAERDLAGLFKKYPVVTMLECPSFREMTLEEGNPK